MSPDRPEWSTDPMSPSGAGSHLDLQVDQQKIQEVDSRVRSLLGMINLEYMLTDSCRRYPNPTHHLLQELPNRPTHTTPLAKAKSSGHRPQWIHLSIHTWVQVPREYHTTQELSRTAMKANPPLQLGRHSSSNNHHHNTHRPIHHPLIEHLIRVITTE
jgi:hypothetical protein